MWVNTCHVCIYIGTWKLTINTSMNKCGFTGEGEKMSEGERERERKRREGGRGERKE